MNALLYDFEMKLSRMKDWPDKALIFEITKFSEVNINLAELVFFLFSFPQRISCNHFNTCV
jgi:hypothetical protein